MPFIRVTLSNTGIEPDKTESDRARRIAEGVTALMAEILGKRRDLTSVLVERADVQAWTVGGKPSAIAVMLEAFITAETNTPDQKADFLDRANALLRREIPGLPEASYIVVREIAGTDWGYDGLSQEERRVRRLAL
jgi:4-oxalocrotonate tautomerase